jgi:hypothetical protein
MTFWNGAEWVRESSTAPARTRRHRATDLMATLVMVLALAVYVLPFGAASAAGASLTVAPNNGVAGTKVTATGDGFAPKTAIQITWDGAPAGLPAATANGRGSFRVSFKVPKAAAGSHMVGATAGSGAVTATTTFDVIAVITPTASPRPTAKPHTPKADATPKPTAAPTTTPVPTSAPTTAPTAAPTVAPSQSAGPTPTATATPAPTSIPSPSPSSAPKLFFGLGTQVENARQTTLAGSTPVEVYSSWYNGPNDLGWITDAWHRSIYADAYASGKSVHLITWTEVPETRFETAYGTACGRAYPLSYRWREDMRELAKAFAGPAGGPPLYVTLFTEFQTYPCRDNAWNPDAETTAYYRALKDQYVAGLAIFHEYAPNARVSIGWGGWQSRWDVPSIGEGRSMIPNFGDVMRISDFVSFQAMAGDSNVTDIRMMTSLLGAYGPVMLAHHMPDSDTNSGSTVNSTFANDVRALLTDASVADLVADGLTAWAFMHDGPLKADPDLAEFVRRAVIRYGRS